MNDSFKVKNAFCCPGLQHRFEAAGQRGISFLVHSTSNGIIFLLQSRGIAFEDVSKLHPIPVDVKMNIASEVGVQYCPFCGRTLQDLVKASPSFFGNLAEKHNPLLSVGI